jgi:hypothetical protein
MKYLDVPVRNHVKLRGSGPQDKLTGVTAKIEIRATFKLGY